MATVSRENIGLLNEKITVKLVKEDYLPSFEKSIKNYAKKANIPGFRKGMVPAGMVRKMYGSGVFTEEVLRTVEKELNNYVEQEKLDFFAQPLPLDNDVRQLDMNNPADYSFAFEIGLKPTINIDLNNVTVTRHKVEITDAMVDEEIERLKVRHGKTTEPETISSEENMLTLNLTESDTDGNEIEGGISKDVYILVKYFTESYRNQLIGKKNDDTLVIQLSAAINENEKQSIMGDLGLSNDDPSAADKYFKATITKIGLMEKPEMNEVFFEEAYPGKDLINEDDFRNAIRNDLQQHWDAQSRNQLHDQIYHQLVDHTHVEFPEGFLKRWMQNGGENPKTAEEAEKEYPGFVNSLKWNLISNQLLTENDLKVEPQEIKEFAKQQILGYMGNLNQEEAPWLDSYAESMLKDKKFIENTFYQLQTNKLFDLLETKVQVNEDAVIAAELTGMQHHHHH